MILAFVSLLFNTPGKCETGGPIPPTFPAEHEKADLGERWSSGTPGEMLEYKWDLKLSVGKMCRDIASVGGAGSVKFY